MTTVKQFYSLFWITSVVVCGVANAAPDEKAAQAERSPPPQEDQLSVRPQTFADLAKGAPDGAALVELYRQANTVADVERANTAAKAEVMRAAPILESLGKLHSEAMASCDQVPEQDLQGIVKKANALATNMTNIDAEVTRSLGFMRQQVASEKAPSQRSREDVDRYIVAAHSLQTLRVQAQEIRKTLVALAAAIRSSTESCRPKPIPGLFRSAFSAAVPKAERASAEEPEKPHKDPLRDQALVQEDCPPLLVRTPPPRVRIWAGPARHSGSSKISARKAHATRGIVRRPDFVRVDTFAPSFP